MNSERRVGIGIVGLGVGEQHARTYAGLRECCLRWLHDSNVERARSLADQLGSTRVAESYEEILADPEVQIVSLASFDNDHFGQVMAALAAGKHVFVEKPLCENLDQLRSVKDAWSQQHGRLKLSSNLVLRAAPLYQWVRKKTAAGDFGRIYAFDGDYLYGRLWKITDGWRKNVPDYSVMFGGGIHLVDLMVWITGERPHAVRTVGNKICTSGTEFRYQDFMAATFQFPSGLIARITANFGCVHRHQHVMRIFGEKATFHYDDSGPRLHCTRDPSVAATSVSIAALPETKGDLIPAFVNAVRLNLDLSRHTQEIFDTISICAASDKAVHSGSPEEITYV
jgi:predicted dehydrogenase